RTTTHHVSAPVPDSRKLHKYTLFPYTTHFRSRTPRLERRTPRCEQSTKGARVAPSHPDPTESPTVLSDSPADELPATVQHMPGSSRSRRSERRPSRIPERSALPQQSPDPIRAGHQQRSPHRLLRQPWPG